MDVEKYEQIIESLLIKKLPKDIIKYNIIPYIRDKCSSCNTVIVGFKFVDTYLSDHCYLCDDCYENINRYIKFFCN